MEFNTQELVWMRQPQAAKITATTIDITTAPHTDLWQRTYYGFQNDNAPVLQMTTAEQYFSFAVKTEFKTHQRFDQCGIVLYLDSDNWLKSSTEYENEEFQRLGSVVTNEGYSDWATMDVSTEHKAIWYRLSRRASDYRLEYSFDGQIYHQMRIAHLKHGDQTIKFGVYACSPEDSSFTAHFSKMQLGECVWEAHK
ncbi:DUF1349 domain-containing protein [Periweissella fabalis]|uniref:DUF1349 domain-containing protein n=1 Tax=Periweissella fabalis TaxID=1070421 RepID=A0A7X6N4G8_9LACO|nr:DUF1349 domain-containing protein [Periweissella fabalis]MCM0599760.1 DUF1349 domain-containing protein [Periweissella fabalis]NKZ24434.1 DUF1349 domain-containing protein [Periweissella fabalis]